MHQYLRTVAEVVGGTAVERKAALLGEQERGVGLLGEVAARLAGEFSGGCEIAALGVSELLGGGAVLRKGDAVVAGEVHLFRALEHNLTGPAGIIHYVVVVPAHKYCPQSVANWHHLNAQPRKVGGGVVVLGIVIENEIHLAIAVGVICLRIAGAGIGAHIDFPMRRESIQGIAKERNAVGNHRPIFHHIVGRYLTYLLLCSDEQSMIINTVYRIS